MHTHIFEVPIDYPGGANVEVAVHRGPGEQDEYEVLNVDFGVPIDGLDNLDDRIAFLDSQVDDLREQILEYIKSELS